MQIYTFPNQGALISPTMTSDFEVLKFTSVFLLPALFFFICTHCPPNPNSFNSMHIKSYVGAHGGLAPPMQGNPGSATGTRSYLFLFNLNLGIS